MTPGTQILLSGALTFGVPIALAVRELLALRRPRGGGPDNPGREDAPPPPPRPGGERHLPPLPACLIEAARIPPASKRAPTPRELETA